MLLSDRIHAMPFSLAGQTIGPTLCSGRLTPYLVAYLDSPHMRKAERLGKSAKRPVGHSGKRSPIIHPIALGAYGKARHFSLKASKVRRVSVANHPVNGYLCYDATMNLPKFVASKAALDLTGSRRRFSFIANLHLKIKPPFC